MAAPATTNGHRATPQSFLRSFSALLARSTLASRLGSLFGGDRPMHAVLGYRPRLSYLDMKVRYLRGDIAHRIVRAYPEATWSQPPTLQEDNEAEIDTPFEAAWTRLQQRLGVYGVLERADILANLGQYAVVLIGLAGQSDLRLPATRVRGPDDVVYLTPYSQEFATIQAFVTDTASAEFGKPLLYQMNFGRSTSPSMDGAGAAMPQRTGLVHASRVVHIAEDLLDDSIYGVPRLEPIFDKLDDLMKVVGGSAEMFWRDAKRRIALEVRDDYDFQEADRVALGEEAEEYQHGLRDFLRLQGVNAKDLSGIVASPKEHFGVLIDLISATTGIPKRLLLGNEAGQLASTQDEDAWIQRVKRRQVQFAEGRMLRPLVDQWIALGALPTPAQPYRVEWGNLGALSEPQRAAVAKEWSAAIASYAGPGMAPQLVPEPEYRERYLGLPPYPNVAPQDLAPGAEEL